MRHSFQSTFIPHQLFHPVPKSDENFLSIMSLQFANPPDFQTHPTAPTKTANSSAYTTRFGSASNTTSPRFNITIRPQSISTSVRSCDINRTEQLLALICSKMPQTPITSFLDKLVVTSSSKIMSLGSELTDAQTSYILRLSP